MSITPSQKPNAVNFRAMVDRRVHCLAPVYLVGIRGYYLNTMGKQGVNDRGIYDDAIGIITEDVTWTFNANVDPYGYRKGIANLVEGSWKYKIGIHGLNKPKALQYKALVQADNVTVLRDQRGLDKGRFGINIHRGGDTKVSSIGCQTIPPAQWLTFLNTVESLMRKYNKQTIDYILVHTDQKT